MGFVSKKQKLDYLLKLIEQGNTGTAEFLCSRIFVSRPTLTRYLADLRELGYQISFCTRRKTYYIVRGSDD
jgi:predicted DNA-binding transcriptional regulator YafY